ncbi:hypothetical protein A8H37_10540 [Burkholderia thailandensis]|nr:hypothetical protein A8H37_10540 [Burkholderia thailandensis]
MDVAGRTRLHAAGAPHAHTFARDSRRTSRATRAHSVSSVYFTHAPPAGFKRSLSDRTTFPAFSATILRCDSNGERRSRCVGRPTLDLCPP